MDIDTQIFHQVNPEPALSTINQGLEMVNTFQPDIIIGFGGGSPMDAAKIMWILYEHPELSFEGLEGKNYDEKVRNYIRVLAELRKKLEIPGIL